MPRQQHPHDVAQRNAWAASVRTLIARHRDEFDQLYDQARREAGLPPARRARKQQTSTAA